MRRQSDTIEFSIPEPAGFAVAVEGVTWGPWKPNPHGFEVTADDAAPAIPIQLAQRLDDFCTISRGDPAARVVRALTLARDWGSPLTLCGICARRHVWDRATPDPRLGRSPALYGRWRVAGAKLAGKGGEPLREWLAWAEIANALRRTAAANRDGRPGDPADLATLWPVALQPDDPHPAGDGSSEPDFDRELPVAVRRARVEEARAGADLRLLIAGTVNEWIRSTCTAPGLNYREGASAGAPAVPVVRVGSILGLLGWVLREELTRQSGAIGTCAVCSVTFFKERRRVDTDKTKSRTLCELHDRQRRKREERRR